MAVNRVRTRTRPQGGHGDRRPASRAGRLLPLLKVAGPRFKRTQRGRERKGHADINVSFTCHPNGSFIRFHGRVPLNNAANPGWLSMTHTAPARLKADGYQRRSAQTEEHTLSGGLHRVGRALLLTPGPVVALVTARGSSWLSPGLMTLLGTQQGPPGADPDGDPDPGRRDLSATLVALSAGRGGSLTSVMRPWAADGRVSRDTGSGAPCPCRWWLYAGLHDRRGNPGDILSSLPSSPQFIAGDTALWHQHLTLPWYGSSSICMVLSLDVPAGEAVGCRPGTASISR